jgi:phage anti-repressor protein
MSNIITLSTQNQQITFQRAEINEVFQEVYDARTLHSELQSQRQFADWIKLKLKRFKEGVDFVSFSQLCDKPLGGRPSTEYLLTIHTATHIAMMENTKRGDEVRDAFIEAEKQLRKLQIQTPQIKQYTKKELLLMALESEERIEALENTVQKKNQEIQVLGYEKEVVEKNLEIKTAEVKEKEIVIETQDNTIKAITNIQDSYSLRQAKSNLCVLESELKEYLLAKKWFQYLANGKTGKDKKNTMQATAYAIKNTFAKDVNVENKAQQKFFKQFRITKHGMAFLIKNRNEIIK